MLEEFCEGFNVVEFWMYKVLCFSYINEVFFFEQVVGYKDIGYKLDKLLFMKVGVLDVVKVMEEYK